MTKTIKYVLRIFINKINEEYTHNTVNSTKTLKKEVIYFRS